MVGLMKLQTYESKQVPSGRSGEVFSLGAERRGVLQLPNEEEAFHRTVDKALDVIEDIDERFRKARQIEQVTDGDMVSARDHADFLHRLQTDPNYQDMGLVDLEKAFDSFASGSRSRILPRMDDNIGRQALAQRIEDRELTSRNAVRSFGRQRQVDRMRAKIDAKLDAYAQRYIATGDIEVFAKVRELLDGHAAVLAISAKERGELQRKFERDAVVGHWQAFAQLAPEEAAAAFEKDGPSEVLDPQVYAALKKYVGDALYQHRSRLLTVDEQRQKQATRALNTIQDAQAGRFWGALRDGKFITPAQLDLARDNQSLSLDEYKALRKAIDQGEGIVDDWAAIEQIEDAIDAERNAAPLINQAVASDRLTVATAISMRSKNRSIQSMSATDKQNAKTAKRILDLLHAKDQADSIWGKKDAAEYFADSLRLTQAVINKENPMEVVANIVEERTAVPPQKPSYQGITYTGEMTVAALTAYLDELAESKASGAINDVTYTGMYNTVAAVINELQNNERIRSSLPTIRRGHGK